MCHQYCFCSIMDSYGIPNNVYVLPYFRCNHHELVLTNSALFQDLLSFYCQNHLNHFSRIETFCKPWPIFCFMCDPDNFNRCWFEDVSCYRRWFFNHVTVLLAEPALSVSRPYFGWSKLSMADHEPELCIMYLI